MAGKKTLHLHYTNCKAYNANFDGEVMQVKLHRAPAPGGNAQDSAQDQKYLKPTVMHALANVELYCLALAHIYSDPNHSQLNHWGVLQALARKGVYVADPSDVVLTETTFIHTSPFRMVSFIILKKPFFFN